MVKRPLGKGGRMTTIKRTIRRFLITDPDNFSLSDLRDPERIEHVFLDPGVDCVQTHIVRRKREDEAAVLTLDRTTFGRHDEEPGGFGRRARSVAVSGEDMKSFLGYLIETTRHVSMTQYQRGEWTIDVHEARFKGLIFVSIEVEEEKAREPIQLPPWVPAGAIEVTHCLNDLHLARINDYSARFYHDYFKADRRFPDLTYETALVMVVGGSEALNRHVLKSVEEKFGRNEVQSVPSLTHLLLKILKIAPWSAPWPTDVGNFEGRTWCNFLANAFAIQSGIEDAALEEASLHGCACVVMDYGLPDLGEFVYGDTHREQNLKDFLANKRRGLFRRYGHIVNIGQPTPELWERLDLASKESYDFMSRREALRRLIWERNDPFSRTPPSVSTWEDIEESVCDTVRTTMIRI